MATPEEMEEEKTKMDSMELHDILLDIIRFDIIKYNETHNIPYFKARLTNDPMNEELKNAAICILDELSDEIENQVSEEEPDKQEQRRENLNMLVTMCEEIIGV